MINLLEILKEVKETFESFAITRGKGAAKIAENAEKKRWFSTFNLASF